MRAPRTNYWSKRQIDAAKEQVKQELDAAKHATPRLRLTAISNGIRDHEQATSPKEFLILFVYVMSALVHHARHGGLSRNDVMRMRGLAHSILQFQRITTASQLSFLYAELHLVLAQIKRQDGDHWSAAWEHELSQQMTKDLPGVGPGFTATSRAIRTLRLGQSQRALQEFGTALGDATLDAANRERALLGSIKALRLSADFSAAQNRIETAQRVETVSADAALELQWETACLAAIRDRDLNTMCDLVKQKGSHCQSVYLVEAILWARCVNEKKWIERLPKASTVARRRDLNARGLGLFMEAVQVIETCYDSAIPLPLRLTSMGDLLGRRGELLTIDRELLVLSAAARWLWRAKQPSLAELVADEYRGICRRLTDGRSDDSFGLMIDIRHDQNGGTDDVGVRAFDSAS